MAFSPNSFLSNVRGKDGLAKPCRFEVILPVPTAVTSRVGNEIIEKILNFPNSISSDINDAKSRAISKTDIGSGNPSLSRNLSLQCESAELPGRTFQTADVKIYGPTFKVPYQSQYADTTLTFICTNDFYEKKLFDVWMQTIHPSDTNNMRYAKGETSGYMTNIKIIQYDNYIKQIYAVELLDAFPIGIAPQPLNWGEEGFHRLAIQFAYQRYNPIVENKYNFEMERELQNSSKTRRLII